MVLCENMKHILYVHKNNPIDQTKFLSFKNAKHIRIWLVGENDGNRSGGQDIKEKKIYEIASKRTCTSR